MADRSTIYEVARLSGVSTATVSRVMSSGTGYSAATAERVRAIAKSLGWYPNAAASGLASRRVGIVGLVFPSFVDEDAEDVESPLYVDQVIRGAELAASAAGNAVLIAAARDAGHHDIAMAIASKVDGLVIMARSLAESDIAELARSIPVVTLAAGAGDTHDTVGADNRDGARQLTTHLVVDHGYDRFATIAGPPDSPDAMARHAGYRDALREAGIDAPRQPDAHGDFTRPGGRDAMRRILAGAVNPPRAVVAGNDQMALGAIGALRAAGLRVPQDVAVTGFDDIAAARHGRPTLTTVDQPMRQLGEQAVQVLLDRIAAPEGPRREVILPTRTVIRRSCGCVRGSSHPGSA